MSEPFDPYRKWLGIPPKDQPPNHYRLLGIATFESDPDVIENAAARQMAHIRTFQTSRHAALSQRLLTELSAAKVCLLVPADKDAYDAALRDKLAAEGKLSSEMPLGPGTEPALPAEMPPLPGSSRAGNRWRTGQANEPPLPEPPPAPIPISLPVGTAVAPMPAVRGRSAASYRGRKKSSPLPLVLTAVCGLLLAAGGIVAAVVMSNQSPAHARGKAKPAAPQAPLAQPAPQINSPSTHLPASSHELAPRREHRRPPGRGEDRPTEFPLGVAEAQPDLTNTVPSVSPPGSVGSSAPAGDPTMPAVDRLRQQLFMARQALARRDSEMFAGQMAMAEQIVADPGLDGSTRNQLKDEIEHLRNLSTLIEQFWATVRDNLEKHIQVGETLGLFQTQARIVSRDGDTVEVVFRGQTNKGPIRELDPVAAALIAAKAAKITEPATYLPIVAFLSLDERAEKEHAEDHVVKFSRRFFNENRLAGPKNLEIAARLGLKLATELPQN